MDEHERAPTTSAFLSSTLSTSAYDPTESQREYRRAAIRRRVVLSLGGALSSVVGGGIITYAFASNLGTTGWTVVGSMAAGISLLAVAISTVTIASARRLRQVNSGQDSIRRQERTILRAVDEQVSAIVAKETVHGQN